MPPLALSDDPLNNEMFLEGLGWLAEEALIRGDKLGMAFGMEARFPFLSRPFQKYCFGLKSGIKISSHQTKCLMRTSYEGILPEFITRKQKSVWSAPSPEWSRRPLLKRTLDEILSEGYHAGTAKLFRFDAIRNEPSLVKKFLFVNFQIWARQNGITA